MRVSKEQGELAATEICSTAIQTDSKPITLTSQKIMDSGEVVKAGEVIGLEETPACYGAHLHFETRYKGTLRSEAYH